MRINRILELNNILNESSCPVGTKSYGGLPSGGGYEANTQYEIGAQRFSEAVHCILGSLGKIYGKGGWVEKGVNNPRGTEEHHIYEELDIIKDAIKTYSRDIYSDMIVRTKQELLGFGYREDDIDSAFKYIERSVKSIKENSPKLKKLASSLLIQVDKYDSDVDELISACYSSLIILAYEMENSVKNYPNKPITNAYKSSRLKLAVNRLENAVDNFYKEK